MLGNDTGSVEFESFVRGFAHPEVIKEGGTGFRGFAGGITNSALANEISYVPHFEDEVMAESHRSLAHIS
jgi:hypothetical protein